MKALINFEIKFANIEVHIPHGADAHEYCKEWFEEHKNEVREAALESGYLNMTSVDELYRVCDICGERIEEGYMFEGGEGYCCEKDFDEWMDENFPAGWKPNDHDDEPNWCGGYYDWYEPREDTWQDTGIFYTEWWH